MKESCLRAPVASLFISHAGVDRPAAERLYKQLQVWGYESLFLDFSPEDGIPAGRDWERELYAGLRRADAVVFLASPPALASPWCFAELTLARFARKPVFPVRLDGAGEHSLLGDLQWVDASADGMRRLHRTLDGTFGTVGSFAWDARRAPYPGLAPFEPEDAAVFFGRDDKIAELLRHLDPTLARGRCVAIIGPSGSGKSSLVRAGLAARLRRSPERWVVLPPLTPGDRPAASLECALSDAAGRAITLGNTHELVETARELAGTGSRRSVVVVLDQAEELVTLSSEPERARFLALLSGALGAASPLWVVATFRSDLLESSLSDAGVVELIDETVLLGPLERARLPAVIEGPARAARVELEPGLVGRMVEDTQGGDALPLLAYTLQQLYEAAGGDAIITCSEYDAIGGVLGALRTRADLVAQRLENDGHGTLVLPTLLKLVRLDADDEPVRRRVPRDELSSSEDAVVQAFIDARLLTSDGALVAVAHEALLRSWVPLAEAIRRSREQLRLRSQLERLAAEWDAAAKHPSYLLRDVRLDGARRLLTAGGGQALATLSGSERAFYEASVARETRERRLRRVRIQRIVGLLTAMFVVAVVLAVVALIQRGNADQSAHNAEAAAHTARSRGLAAQAATALDAQPDLAVLLALEAWRADTTPEARGAALAALHRTAGVRALLRDPNGADASAIAFSPRGDTIAVAGQDSMVRLWDRRSRRVVGDPLTLPLLPASAAVPARTQPASTLAFSPDGSRLAAATGNHVVLWAIRGEDVRRIRQSKLFEAEAVAFAADGSSVVAGGFEQIARYDARSGRRLKSPGGVPYDSLETGSVAVAAGDEKIALLQRSGDLSVWDATRLRRPRRVHHTHAIAGAFSADAQTLAVLRRNGVTRLIDVARGRPHGPRIHAGADARTITIAGGHDTLAVGNASGAITLWNGRTGHRIGERIQAARRAEGPALAFAPDGRTLAVGGSGPVGLWGVSREGTFVTRLSGPHRVHGPSGAFAAFAGSSANRLLAATGEGATIWDTASATAVKRYDLPFYMTHVLALDPGGDVLWADDGTRPVKLAGSGNDRSQLQAKVALMRDGRRAIVSRDPTAVQLVELPGGTSLGDPVRRPGTYVAAIATDAAGTRLATAGLSSRIWLTAIGDRGLAAPRPDRPLTGHSGYVGALAFNPRDGRMLASAASDGTVRLWDFDRRAPDGEPLLADEPVTSVAFSPDGRTLAAGALDGALRLWDVTSRQPLGGPFATRDANGDAATTSVAFSPDGRALAVVDALGSVTLFDSMLWSRDGTALARRLCAVASRNLTSGEWAQYLPGRPYRTTCPTWPPDSR